MKKRIYQIFLSMMLVLFFTYAGNADDRNTSLMSSSTTQSIFILNTGDIHEFSKHLTQLSSKVKEMRQRYKVVLLVDSGDLLDQNPSRHPRKVGYGDWSTLKPKGNKIFKWAQNMHYDAMLLGNHDLVGGIKYTEKLMKKYKLPFIASNISCTDLKIPKSRIITKKFKTNDGKDRIVKIGIIGFMDQNHYKKNGKWVTDYHMSDGDRKIFKAYRVNTNICKQYVKELRKRCDIIIFLSHNADYVDENYLASMKNPPVKIIVGGHSHNVKKGKISGKKNAYLIKPGGPKGNHIGGELLGNTVIEWNFINKNIEKVSMRSINVNKIKH